MIESDSGAIESVAGDGLSQGRSDESDGPSIFVCAGDVSGDGHAARLFGKLKEIVPDVRIWGIGGTQMENAGVDLIYHSQSMAVVGIMAVVKVLPLLKQVRERILQELGKRRPDIVLLVDYGGFNLGLAQSIAKRFPDLPIVYFISPQVWGSRPWRINAIARTVKKMLVIFPFEEPLYQAHDVNVSFVGHPLVERLAQMPPVIKEQFCAEHGLDPTKPIVGIFPGSRTQEIKDFMGFLLQAMSWLHKERPDVQFVLSKANLRIADIIYQQLDRFHKTEIVGTYLKLIPEEANHGLMSVADLLWTKSGTTTLEAALMEKPMLVFYRGDWISFALFLMFKRVKYVAWPNLIASQMLVPELIQLDCRAEQLVRYTRDWLDVPAKREDVAAELRSIKSRLGKGDFAANAAGELAKVLGKI